MNTENNKKNEFTEFTELNMNESSIAKKKEKNEPIFWQSVLVGGVPGLLIGASGALTVHDMIARPISDPENGQGQEIQEDASIRVAHSVSDNMSFAEAFAAARAEVGPGGAFVWHGNVYGTYKVDDPEWQNMSDEARTEFSHDVMSQVHPTPYTPTEHEPEIVANTTPAAAEDPVESEDNVDVHFVNVGQVVAEDGTTVTVGQALVKDHLAAFIDSDGDGEVDTVQIDLNDNGALDSGDAVVMQHTGITVEQMAAQASDPLESIYNDMPDYTNDADTGSYV